MDVQRKKVLSLFGTRPEVVKFAPILRCIEASAPRVQAINVASGQHTDLLYPLVRYFSIRVHHDLSLSKPQGSNQDALPHRIVQRFLPVLDREQPDLILIQGDTSTALAGAMAGRTRNIPVGHIEAGLRSGDLAAPFPEELNRRMISRLATYHFAPTCSNRDVLIHEGVAKDSIFLTGNPGVDSLLAVLKSSAPTAGLKRLLASTHSYKRIILTAHRRENFAGPLEACFKVLRRFVDTHPDVVVIFPVHPNPALSEPSKILGGHPRILMTGAMSYRDFVQLMFRSWLIISDSGGIQEETPSLGKPLLILRRNTERPEALACGAARLAGTSAKSFSTALEENSQDAAWLSTGQNGSNPFGRGDSGAQIVNVIHSLLGITPK
jgi:UDP-N-acetylglucosamine 2-epimerase (non-hydrolysing)